MPCIRRISVFLEHMLTSKKQPTSAYVSLPVTLFSPLALDGGVVVDWSNQLTAVFHDKYERTQQVIEVARGHHVHQEHASQVPRWQQCPISKMVHSHYRGWHTLPQLDTRAPADKMPRAPPRYRPLLNGPAEPYHTPVFSFPTFLFHLIACFHYLYSMMNNYCVWSPRMIWSNSIVIGKFPKNAFIPVDKRFPLKLSWEKAG